MILIIAVELNCTLCGSKQPGLSPPSLLPTGSGVSFGCSWSERTTVRSQRANR